MFPFLFFGLFFFLTSLSKYPTFLLIFLDFSAIAFASVIFRVSETEGDSHRDPVSAEAGPAGAEGCWLPVSPRSGLNPPPSRLGWPQSWRTALGDAGSASSKGQRNPPQPHCARSLLHLPELHRPLPCGPVRSHEGAGPPIPTLWSYLPPHGKRRGAGGVRSAPTFLSYR